MGSCGGTMLEGGVSEFERFAVAGLDELQF